MLILHKMIILSSKLFLKIFTRDTASAITLFPFIIINGKKHKSNKTLLNHEMIHIWQQLETFIFLFYLQYFVEYLYHRLKGKNHYDAYYSISMEQEAYKNEDNLEYLKSRRLWAWWKYL